MPTHAWANRVCSSVLCVLLLMTVLSACTASGGGGSPPTTIWIVDDISVSTCPLSGEEVERDCTVRAPTDQAPGERLPVIVLLHGFGGTPGGERASGGWDDAVVANRFVLVTPGGQHDGWNAGGCCGLAQSLGIDDVGYLAWLISWVRGLPIVDPGRVGLVGFSNGGMMAQRLACEQADRIAGIATVAGGLPEPLQATCKPARALPVLVIHGTEDPIVPWSGGAVAGFEDFGKVLSARETAKFWAANNRCGDGGVIAAEPDRDPKDGTRVKMEVFASCPAGAAVKLAAVEGGGHTWPGGYQYLPERFIGRTSRDIDANQIIWNFFRRAAR